MSTPINDPPLIERIEPHMGLVNTPVTITGKNFIEGCRLIFGGIPTAVSRQGGNLFAFTPEHALGSVDVEVINPDEQRALLKEAFVYVVGSGNDSPTGNGPIDLNDPTLFARFSPACRGALRRAEGMRRTMGITRDIHMEHLIAGLVEEKDETVEKLFRSAELDPPTILSILKETVKTDIPKTYRSPALVSLPRTSKHVGKAIQEAVRHANEKGAKHVRSRHLLYGALSIEECKVIKALADRVGKENLDVPHEKEADDSEDERYAERAYPTPKVDSDLWCERDQLGYESYARTIASLITHPQTKPPLTIGIKAPWGAGKTSLMKRVQHLLDGDAAVTERNETGTRHLQQTSEMTFRQLLHRLKDTVVPRSLTAIPSQDGKLYGLDARITVWFNAWKYQTSEQIWSGMAHCIISQITARMGAKDRELFWLRLHAKRIKTDEVRWSVYQAVLRETLPFFLIFALFVGFALLFMMPLYLRVVLSLLSLAPAVYRAIRKFGDKAAGAARDLIREPDYDGKMGFLYLVESDIRDVLDVASISKDSPLVIFVDDLDRCVPRKVAEVVEAINLFLCGDYPNCVFVLGMEPGMVAAALEVANQDVINKAKELSFVDSTVPVGWRFMEKIIQLPIIVPRPTKEALDGYVKSLTSAVGLDAAEKPELRSPNDPPSGQEDRIQNFLQMFKKEASSLDSTVEYSDWLLEQSPQEERWAAAEASKQAFHGAFSERDPMIARFVNDVAYLVGGNPRQIKRYLNVFRFYCTLRHSLGVDAKAHGLIAKLPSDAALAKFVALNINWPHAIDCFRTRDSNTAGNSEKPESVLELLEKKSKEFRGNDEQSDREWLEFINENQWSLFGEWVCSRTFRHFLSRGESLCEGHGLW